MHPIPLQRQHSCCPHCEQPIDVSAARDDAQLDLIVLLLDHVPPTSAHEATRRLLDTLHGEILQRRLHHARTTTSTRHAGGAA